MPDQAGHLSGSLRLPYRQGISVWGAFLLLLAVVGLIWATLDANQPFETSTWGYAAIAHDEPVLTAETSSLTARPQAGERVLLLAAETWDELTRSNVERALALLPAGVRNNLGNPDLGPLLIHVNSEGKTISGRRPYGGPANFYATNEGINEVVIYPGQSVVTILHELGHAHNLRRVAAGAYAHVFLDAEMRSFMSAIGWQVNASLAYLAATVDHTRVAVAYSGPPVWTNLSREDPLEDYANSFALYFAAPAELEALSSARYAWFKAQFGGD